MLVEIALNAGSVALEGAATRRCGVLSWHVATGRCSVARRTARSAWIRAAYADRTHGMLAHFMERLHRPIAVVCDNLRFFHTANGRSTCGSYRIVSRYFV